MADRSKRYSFTLLDSPRDGLKFEGYRFGLRDRHLLDRLLNQAAEHHVHTGAAAISDEQPDSASLALGSNGSGLIPAGVGVFYRYSLVDNFGNETAASVISSIRVPGQIPPPLNPILSSSTASGTLVPGVYDYAVSAYTEDTRFETQASESISTTLTSAGTITLTLPSIHNSATGYNVYRKAPLDDGWKFLASVAYTASTYVDSGSVVASSFRSLPRSNKTFDQNSVVVTLPEALPSGYTWKLYRTYNQTNWSNSFLAWSDDASFTDTGLATGAASPPLASMQLGSAPKVNLTDVSEAQGYLPPGANVYPQQINFAIEGYFDIGYSPIVWVCEYDQADIISVRASLGLNSYSSGDDIIVSLSRLESGEVLWSELVECRSFIVYPNQVGELNDVVVDTDDRYHLVNGDALRLEVLQVDDSATPAHGDLNVTVTLLTQVGSAVASHEWSS